MKLKCSILFFLMVIPCLFYSQGYKKYYKPPGYTFRAPEALVTNESTSTGFFMYSQSGKINVEISSIDSFGAEELIHSIPNDSFQSSVQRTLQANLSALGHLEGEIVFIHKQSRPLKIKIHSYFPNTTELNTFGFVPPITLVNLRVFNIIKVKDGYLVTGDWVLPGESPRGYILAINKDFSLRYWKWYSTPYPDIEIYGAIEKDSFYLLYGYIHIVPLNAYGWFHKKVDKENGAELFSEVYTTNPHCYRLYEDETDPTKFVGIATYSNIDKTELVPSWVLMDENFNVLKQTEYGIRFHQIQRIGGKIEYPYHSARDKEGNYIVATQQFLPFDLFLNPQGPFTEVLCLTKISSEGDVLWETRDSVVYYPNINEWTVGNITGVSTGPEGEIYVLGSVDDIDTTINQYKTVGYIFKYDKHGCRIEDCRIVSTINIAPEVVFHIYPNPANDFLNIKTEGIQEGEVKGFEIIDMQGQVIYRSSILQKSIDLEYFRPGMYMICLIDENGRTSFQKFVKI